jgi:lipopolysaccharide transport system ATP-binding protein
MSDTVIKVENISKVYRLGSVGRTTMKEDLSRFIKSLKGKEKEIKAISNNRQSDEKSDYVWSLKDINFEVKQGEVLGIVGKNGAGKSTLLKLLSRVTQPTTGTIKYKGRIASLLEVGTGFHPELTGRENIFLNGAILGMNKAEIKSKFDEIVDFSGVGNYIDTPVKRYSSGMYVRLAFAVAAHLEPEILILDEVLAVGDAEFQKKCLGKMKSVSGEGRTVLFVSHNMDAVNTLCSKVLMLEHGKKVFEGDTREGVNFYLKSGIEERFGEIIYKDATNTATRSGNKKQLEIRAIRTKNAIGEVDGQLVQGEKMSVEIDFAVKEFCVAPELGFAIKNPSGAQLAFIVSDWYQPIRSIEQGLYTYQFEVNNMDLIPGEYSIDVWARPQMGLPSDDYIESPLSLMVIQSIKNTNTNYSFYAKFGGVLQQVKGQLL